MDVDDRIFTFDVNEDGRIAAVSDNWDAFAQANDGEDACACHVLGRPWTDFVTGLEMRLLYTMLISKVRKTGRSVTVPFRCDGPSVRRFMTMAILPTSNKSIRFQCELVREEPRETAEVLSRTVVRGGSRLTLCSWCGQAEIGHAWLDLEVAIRVLRLFEVNEMPTLSHGICLTCETRLGHIIEDV